MQFGKKKPFWERTCSMYERFVKDLWVENKSNLAGWSTAVLQKYPLCLLCSICQNCRNLRAFLGVKFGSTVLLRVKELPFCNSGHDGSFCDPELGRKQQLASTACAQGEKVKVRRKNYTNKRNVQIFKQKKYTNIQTKEIHKYSNKRNTHNSNKRNTHKTNTHCFLQ